jgi:putative endonuclease
MNDINSWFVYLLKCCDDTLYCGITNDIQKRVTAHNNKKGAKYTQGRTPVVYLGCRVVANKSEALKMEYKVKKLKKQQKLEFFDYAEQRYMQEMHKPSS